MTRVAVVLAPVILFLIAIPLRPRAQDAGRGAALYGERCSACHGADARGGNGPALVNLWTAGASDERVLRTIRQGVPGSAMPPSAAPDAELEAIVQFLKTLATGASAAGGRGAAPLPQAVTLVVRDGTHISGARRGEDAFSIQIEEGGGRLQGYLKADLKEIIRSSGPPPSVGASAPLVTSRDLLGGLADPSRWLTFSGDYTGRRHSPLTQITPANVHRLATQWTFQSGTMTRGRGFEATALALDGVLYVTGSNNFAWALDARTGRPFWQYRRELPADLTYGAQAPVNRGFAMLGDRLFMVTLDAHLLALDRKSGAILWDTVLADYKIGYSATSAPLVIGDTGGDKVIVGISGGEYPTRGFLDAYDPQTGTRIWRFYTVPAPGEPGSETWPPSSEVLARGGGGTWMTGSYDPDLNLLFWGTGNPNPDYYGAGRLGDNLYTNALIAIDADTGRLKWHFQFTPHDTHDWDSNHVPVLADLNIAGTPRKVVMVANRNGFFYVLDRATGALVFGKPFTDTTWAREIGARWPSDRVERRQQGMSARSMGRNQLQSAVVRSLPASVLRDRARDLRHLHAAGTEVRARPVDDGRRRPGGSRPRLRRAASDRRDHRRTPLGVPVSDADDGRRAVDRLRPGLRRRQRRQFHGVRRRLRARTCGAIRPATASGALRR